MIAALEKYDSTVAAGMLARAALELDSYGSNPAGKPAIDGETEIRRRILFEVGLRLGVASEDNRPETISRVCDVLDELADELVGDPEPAEALARLAERGELPSDRFELNIIPDIRDFYGEHFPNEELRIRETVRSPWKEQHFGPPTRGEDPFLVSLFARYYPNRFPYRSFYLLVAGGRNGLVLDVHQVWRIYPSVVKQIVMSSNLISILERFADVYGVNMTIGTQKGRFILSTPLPSGTTEIRAVIEEPNTDPRYKGPVWTVTFFDQRNPFTGDLRASLAVAIDLKKYRETIETMGW